MKLRKSQNKKTYLIGYAHKDIRIYKTDLKPLGRIVAGLGFVCLGVAVIPNGLGLIMYPIGFGLLGLVGINPYTYKKKVVNKLRFVKWRLLG